MPVTSADPHSNSSSPAPIGGVFAAAVTPRLNGSCRADVEAALELVDFFCSTAVKGITLLGATGEFPHFDLEERARLAEQAIRRSSLPVMVNVSHSSLAGAVHLAREAAQAGAAALLVMPPYYFRYSEADVGEFLRQFAAETGTAVPLFLYNIPFFTAPVPADVAFELLANGTYAGIKDSSGDWELMSRLLEQTGQTPFRVMVGNDSIFTRARSAGAHGSVSGVACAVPELVTALDWAISKGAASRQDQLEARLQEFIARIDVFPTPVGIREAMAARGIRIGGLANPLPAATARKAVEFREWFSTWWMEVGRELG